MALLFSNNAESTLAADIDGITTTIVVANNEGQLFPELQLGSDEFLVTLEAQDRSANEICRVVNRNFDTFTVERGHEGTQARAFVAGDRVSMRVTAGMLSTLQQSGGGGGTDDSRVKDLVMAAMASLLEKHTVAGSIVLADEDAIRQAMDDLP